MYEMLQKKGFFKNRIEGGYGANFVFLEHQSAHEKLKHSNDFPVEGVFHETDRVNL